MKVVKPKKKRKKIMGEIDYGVFYTVLLLVSIGTVMVYSASSYYAMHNGSSSTAFLVKQAFAAILGFICMFIFSHVDYHILRKFTMILVFIC